MDVDAAHAWLKPKLEKLRTFLLVVAAPNSVLSRQPSSVNADINVMMVNVHELAEATIGPALWEGWLGNAKSYSKVLL